MTSDRIISKPKTFVQNGRTAFFGLYKTDETRPDQGSSVSHIQTVRIDAPVAISTEEAATRLARP